MLCYLMPQHFFKDVYPGFNAEITVHDPSEDFHSKTDIHITRIENDEPSYLFTLLQKSPMDTTELLDTEGNHICTFDNLFLKKICLVY